MIREFSRAYVSRGDAPVARRFDDTIFTATYYQDCMGCTFCHDVCCSFGADIDVDNIGRLLAEGTALEQFVGSPGRPNGSAPIASRSTPTRQAALTPAPK